ncbi:MAG: serine/threonine protein kinase [Verrucomicrobiales bacterium]|nr:serine/threonine protein kinase [Verrucomicrobiales bacterium]
MNLTSGTKLGPYEVRASIDAGGMGEVYRARDTRLNRDVAIKVLPKDFASDPGRLRRFEQEAKTLAALNHPNVLTIHDAGVHDGAPYLVSELLEGKTLRKEMESWSGAVSVPSTAVADRRYSGLPVRKATEYALQMAHGLDAAHGKDVIHRDLKPENIFITRDGRVKILDFGLAKLRENPKSEIRDPKSSVNAEASTVVQAATESTEPGMILGTPAYMSPEQVRGEPADHRADIFAFGCVLYEMLSGMRVFRRETPVASMNAVLSEEPPDIAATNAAIPLALERVVRRCLEKNPENRFQSAKDLAFAIENTSSTSQEKRHSGVARPQKGGRTAALLMTELASPCSAWQWVWSSAEPAVARSPTRPQPFDTSRIPGATSRRPPLRTERESVLCPIEMGPIEYGSRT